MKALAPYLCLPVAAALACTGCGKKQTSSGDEPVSILTNAVESSYGTEVPVEMTIAGVTREQEMSLIDMLHVTGLLTRGTQQVAIINGTVVTMGEDMYLDVDGQTFKLQVLSIKGEIIKLRAEPVDQAPTPL